MAVMDPLGMSSSTTAPPVAAPIKLCVPEIGGNEWQYIKDCLDTKWVSSVGSYVDRFERMVADYVGATHAVAVVNGTAALHTALLVAGVEPGDEVLVSALSFIAPANAIRYAGAWPVFIDAEPRHWQMDAGRTVEFLEQGCDWTAGRLINKTTGRRVRAVLPVHILGHPVDFDPILESARKYGLAVIEDATESIGATYKQRKVGLLGDIACFSFNGNKLLTTGGGGMIVTNNEAMAGRAKYLTTQAKDDPVEFAHGDIGYNYRLTNVLAAMGCAQLERINEYIERKRRIAERYSEAFQALPGVEPMSEASWAFSVYWMYTVLIEAGGYGMDSRRLLSNLASAHIEARPLWQPLHRSAPHASSQVIGGEIAERLNQECLSLPCSVGLTHSEQERVIDVVVQSAQG